MPLHLQLEKTPKGGPKHRRMPMSDAEFIDPKKLRSGSIRHHALSPEVLERAEAVYGAIGRYRGSTLEQFEVSLTRDADTASEVVVWCSIVSATPICSCARPITAGCRQGDQRIAAEHTARAGDDDARRSHRTSRGRLRRRAAEFA